MSYNKKVWVLWGFSTIAVLLVILLPPVAQPPAYHNFADKRGFWGMPNAANVLSNIPFLAIGICGIRDVHGERLARGIRVTYFLLFTGVLLTGLGSAYYHWHPNNVTLVWDRIPMTIVFMALLSATIAELVSSRWGPRLLPCLIAAGIASVWYWHEGDILGHGDLRFYGLVQFFPVLCIPLILGLFYDPAHYRIFKILGWVVVWYLIAKIGEIADWPVYHATGISGHTLKHFSAAVSAWYLVALFREKYREGHAAKRRVIP